jgi:hypothetical protein
LGDVPKKEAADFDAHYSERCVNFLIISPSSPSYASVAAITVPNKMEYSERHGVRFLPLDYPQATQDKGYGRMAFMREHIESCDWLMNMDGDAMFTNMTIDARQFCFPDADIVVSWDCMGFHSGVMFLRNCAKVIELLDLTIKAKETDGKLRDFMASSDQGAMVRILSQRETYANNIPIADCQAFGARVVEADKTINRYYQDWKPGDFIFHTPGMSIQEKASLLTHRARQVAR